MHKKHLKYGINMLLNKYEHHGFKLSQVHQKYVALYDPKVLPTKTYHLKPVSTRIRSLTTSVTDLQHTLNGI